MTPELALEVKQACAEAVQEALANPPEERSYFVIDWDKVEAGRESLLTHKTAKGDPVLANEDYPTPPEAGPVSQEIGFGPAQEAKSVFYLEINLWRYAFEIRLGKRP